MSMPAIHSPMNAKSIQKARGPIRRTSVAGFLSAWLETWALIIPCSSSTLPDNPDPAVLFASSYVYIYT
jgi:hypothetical protein